MDLVTSRFGGAVVACNDDFFADVSNLIDPAPPVWREGEFTDRGKWMDGWETRRRRDEGHDWCVVALGLPGVIESVTLDTSFFTGNFPEQFSLDASGDAPDRHESAEWAQVITPTPLEGDSVRSFPVDFPYRVTLVRLNIHPDGGVARLRVEGRPIPDIGQVCPDVGPVDLAAAVAGGRGAEASDSHYASPANLVSPTEPAGMWDGWETRRRRGPGHDWAVIELGLPGVIEALDVDTRHFKGNAPGWVTVDAAAGDGPWMQASERVAVEAHAVNRIPVSQPVDADRVRVNIHPDGGLARVRVWGRPRPEVAEAARLRYLNALFPSQARSFFRTACSSSAWVEAMVTARPYQALADVLERAEEAFDGLGREDWLEAFAAHPRIGGGPGGQDAAGEAMSSEEQSGMDRSTGETREEMAVLNRTYEQRFGYTYIVRAAGRDGEDLLALARDRLQNHPTVEVDVAAAEQRDITRRRLRRMVCRAEEE